MRIVRRRHNRITNRSRLPTIDRNRINRRPTIDRRIRLNQIVPSHQRGVIARRRHSRIPSLRQTGLRQTSLRRTIGRRRIGPHRIVRRNRRRERSIHRRRRQTIRRKGRLRRITSRRRIVPQSSLATSRLRSRKILRRMSDRTGRRQKRGPRPPISRDRRINASRISAKKTSVRTTRTSSGLRSKRRLQAELATADTAKASGMRMPLSLRGPSLRMRLECRAIRRNRVCAPAAHPHPGAGKRASIPLIRKRLHL